MYEQCRWILGGGRHRWVGLVVSVHFRMSGQDKIAISLFWQLKQHFTSFFILITSAEKLEFFFIPVTFFFG